jgi:pteridine reductase
MGKHVLVTGAARRVGRVIAEHLLQRGVNLSAHFHHSQPDVENLLAHAKRTGARAVAVRADLKQPREIQAAVTKCAAQLGPIDILINSASIFHPSPALECSEAEWDEMLDANLKGQFFFAQAAARTMVNRSGVIINIADVHASKPIRNYTPYASSKAGLIMMTRNLAREWAPLIRVNSISPGPVLLPETYTEAQKERSIERTLLKRLGSPEDIAQGTLFLIANDYITGFDLKVDGGRSLVEGAPNSPRP